MGCIHSISNQTGYNTQLGVGGRIRYPCSPLTLEKAVEGEDIIFVFIYHLTLYGGLVNLE